MIFLSIGCFANEFNFGSFLSLDSIDTKSEKFIEFTALFGLGIIGLIALFLSSERLRQYEKKVHKEKKKKEEFNTMQGQMLSEMTENIQSIAKETVSTAKELYTNNEKSTISRDIKKVVSSEARLLSITTNLIEFLRIKSRKVEIVDEDFILCNLLNDVTGTLKEATKDIELNLIYDVQKDISEHLRGDTLNTSKIVVNLALFCIEHDAKEIVLEVSKGKYNNATYLYFKVLSFIDVDVEDESKLFSSNYNENNNSYDSLSLFIAKELAILMNGDIYTKNNKNGSVEFTFFSPFKEHPEAKKSKPDYNVANKMIYLLDTSENTTTSIKNMLLSMHHSVKVDTKESCLTNTPDFSKFDLVIIDEKVLTFKVIEALKVSKAKIISLSNIFGPVQDYPNSAIINVELSKPVTRQQLITNINGLFQEKTKGNTSGKDVFISSSKLPAHRSLFEDVPNITLNSFSQFRGSEVLLVEDNLINQKVTTSLLSKSEMTITIANDGQEAIDILKNSGKKFNIVFMDINMPIMDGYTATKLIRADKKFDNLPIVALSALTSPSEISNMFKCGMNGYLSKPLIIGRFFAAFSTFLEKKDEIVLSVKEPKKIVNLDGLDVQIGIVQANNSDIFYKEILLEFKDAYGESGDIFEKLIKDFRFEQLKMLCVDLRGISGSIGARDMYKLVAEVIQRLILKKYELMPMYIEPFKKEINKIIASIDMYTKQI
jgi:CheY-like chemotaxis protein